MYISFGGETFNLSHMTHIAPVKRQGVFAVAMSDYQGKEYFLELETESERDKVLDIINNKLKVANIESNLKIQ